MTDAVDFTSGTSLSGTRLENWDGPTLSHMTGQNKGTKLCKFPRLRIIYTLLPFLLSFGSWGCDWSKRPCWNFSCISSLDPVVCVSIFSSLLRVWPGSSSLKGSDSAGELPLKCALWVDHSRQTWVYHPAEVGVRAYKETVMGWRVLCLGDQGWNIDTVLPSRIVSPPRSRAPLPFQQDGMISSFTGFPGLLFLSN